MDIAIFSNSLVSFLEIIEEYNLTISNIQNFEVVLFKKHVTNIASGLYNLVKWLFYVMRFF